MELNWEKILSVETESTRSKMRSNDSRSPFDSDYSRITFSAPFRRLQDKTQVFPLEQNDFVRTRLTHSIEVASLARSLGKSISSELNKKNGYGWKEKFSYDLPVILECAGLVHDIGNPPFGHSSEKAIQKWFSAHKVRLIKEFFNKNADKWSLSKIDNKIKHSKRVQDFLNFDGNVQGFRILTHLQCIYDYQGYHLTSALLSTIMKYPVDSLIGNKDVENNKTDHKFKKFGYFDSESDIAEFTLKNCGLIDEKKEHYRSPLTIILEAADDIAYSAADIEDGFKKGLFTLDSLLDILKKNREDACVQEVLCRFCKKENIIKLEERKIQWLRICIHQVYCDTVVKEFIDNYDLIMTGRFSCELLKFRSLKCLRELLENFSYNKLINNQEVSKLEIAGKNVISFLLDEFTNDLIVYGIDSIKTLGRNIEIEECKNSLEKTKTWNLISEDFKDIYWNTVRKKSLNSTSILKTDIIYYTYLLITDFISGMTDHYCIRLYRRLQGIDFHN